jgi:biotin carboxylase
MKSEQVANVRRKSAMKAFYEKAGVPVARYHMVGALEDGLAFAKKVGYPVFVKPDGGMGAEESYKLSNEAEMRHFYETRQNVDYIMEEFITGDIWSYDGISDSKGDIIFETTVSWPRSVADIVNNKDHLSYYTTAMLPEDLKEKGRATIKAFDVRSRFFHLEFFRLLKDKEGLAKKGEIVALEVNMRPAGGWTPDMYNYANSVDVYSIWADMVVYDKTYIDLTQRKYYAVYAGWRYGKPYVHTQEQIRERYGDRIVMDEEIPDILSGAMGNHMWTARLDTEAEKDEFIAYVQETF